MSDSVGKKAIANGAKLTSPNADNVKVSKASAIKDTLVDSPGAAVMV
jgi:hypothetical protein